MKEGALTRPEGAWALDRGTQAAAARGPRWLERHRAGGAEAVPWS